MKLRFAFTLIELVLAMAILSLMATTSALILSSSLRSTERSLVTNKVRSEGEFIMQSVSQLARYSSQVRCNADGSITAATKDSIAAVLACDPAGNAISSGSATMTLAQVRQNDITSPEVLVQSCTFTCTPAAPSSPTKFRIQFSLTDVNTVIPPLNYDSEIILRNTP